VRSSTWKLSLTLVLVTAFVGVPSAAQADPLASKRAEADAVMEQIRDLDASVT
jgi:hypothetical protein